MCTFWHSPHKDPSLETVKHWIKELVNFGVKYISIGGGEPFIRKDLVDIVKEIKSYGVVSSVTTSGCLVGDVPFPPVDRCEISIDGANPETHDKIRGVKGSWDKAVAAVKIAKQHCRVSQLNFVLQPDNYREVVDFCRLAKKLGVVVGLIPVSLKLAAQASISDDLHEFDIPLLKRLLQEAFAVGNVLNNQEFFKTFLSKIENGEASQPCMSPFHCVLIFANGDVYPCGNFDIPVGNLGLGVSFKEVYKNYTDWRQKILSGEHTRCRRCIYPDIITRRTLQSSVAAFMKGSLNKKKEILLRLSK
jgi:MoaA/NifB/PqqE/SkfB family radical SAM enzyme